AAVEAAGRRVRGFGPFGPAAGRLALGSTPRAHRGAGLARAGRGAQVVELQAGPAGLRLFLACHGQSTSSTVTRWRTARIMPRNSGLSSLTTTSPIRLSPSDRSESRCRL